MVAVGWQTNQPDLPVPGSRLTKQGDRDIAYAVSYDGRNWTPPQVLDTGADTDAVDETFPALTFDFTGTWTAMWSTVENSAIAPTDGDIRTVSLTEWPLASTVTQAKQWVLYR